MLIIDIINESKPNYTMTTEVISTTALIGEDTKMSHNYVLDGTCRRDPTVLMRVCLPLAPSGWGRCMGHVATLEETLTHAVV